MVVYLVGAVVFWALGVIAVLLSFYKCREEWWGTQEILDHVMSSLLAVFLITVCWPIWFASVVIGIALIVAALPIALPIILLLRLGS